MKHKEKIIVALEKYTQGKSRLCTIQGEQEKFCIAGIFCEVHRQAKKGKWEVKSTLHSKDKIMSYLGESHFLPEEVQKYFGVTREIGRVKAKIPIRHFLILDCKVVKNVYLQ